MWKSTVLSSGKVESVSIPNVRSMNFVVTSTAVAGTVVGRMYADNGITPVNVPVTSWAITAGPGGFAIDNTGLITVSGSSLTGTGNAFMLVTATNAAGTSGPKPIYVQWGTATGVAPSISPNTNFLNTRNLFTPAASGTYFGCRMMASCINSGTGQSGPSGQLTWAIVSGNAAGNFTIDQYNGEIRTAKAVSGSGTATLGITAANGTGTSATWSLIVNWQALPSWLNGFPTFPGGPVVGVTPGSPLAIASAPSVVANTTYQNMAIDGQIFPNANNAIFKNCSIFFPDNFPVINLTVSGITGLLFQNCEFWGNGLAGTLDSNDEVLSSAGGGDVTFQNCDLHDNRTVFTLNHPPITIINCYTHDLNANTTNGAHYENLQYSGGDPSNSGTISVSGSYFDNFNGQSSTLELEAFNGTLVNPVRINNNILIGGNFPIVCIDHGHGNPTDCAFTNNFLGTGQLGYTDFTGTPTFTGNKDWITGAAL